jgi:hypothetical protein
MLSCCDRSEEATRGMVVHWLRAGIEKRSSSLIWRWMLLGPICPGLGSA